MAKTVDLSVSTRGRQSLVAGAITEWVTLPLLAAVFQAGLPVVPSLVVGGWLALVVLWVRRLDGSAEGSTWDVIPGWRYDGRFAGAGGLVRDEQEEALGQNDDE
ncbi:hypothetical protein ACFQL1_03540 [Halomicroarcula sp. GCM10025709]|uniref:hypothetical protein n=1 Tax=Haloarcula TaxID=2237 RepID=UPI0024C3F622|nr:hypothetical protein [Halomicroarcula sp. YJ-61-S]